MQCHVCMMLPSKKKCMYDAAFFVLFWQVYDRCLSCAILPKIDTNLCLGHIISDRKKEKKQIEVKIE